MRLFVAILLVVLLCMIGAAETGGLDIIIGKIKSFFGDGRRCSRSSCVCIDDDTYGMIEVLAMGYGVTVDDFLFAVADGIISGNIDVSHLEAIKKKGNNVK